jgi:hypothetical protein
LNPDTVRSGLSGSLDSAPESSLLEELDEGAGFDFGDRLVLIADVDMLNSWRERERITLETYRGGA